MDAAVTESVKAKFVALDSLFDERLRRRWAAVEARQIGRGGIASNRWARVRLRIDEIRAAVDGMQPGEVKEVPI